MDKKIAIINIIYAITDTLVCGAAVAVFAFCAYHFDRWWIVLFSILPLLFYNNRSIILNADMGTAQPGEKGDQDGT